MMLLSSEQNSGLLTSLEDREWFLSLEAESRGFLSSAFSPENAAHC